MDSSPRIGRPSEDSGGVSVADGEAGAVGVEGAVADGDADAVEGVLVTEGVSVPHPPSASVPRTVATARDEVIFMAPPQAS
ncbi:hypothetical protein [Nocardioides sp. NPDC006303]|uniref:hypothetical protein n=1 Tax=Nocardioides sp. NPDC006303 TaxID=3156747 RepID=UPI0033AC7B9E